MGNPVEFRSPAYRALVKALGESDAVVEWIEVGIREIQRVNQVRGGAAVKQLAVEHGVCVHPIDLSDLRNRCARLQVLAVYQQLEYFLSSFRKTHPRKVKYERKDDDDPLTATLAAFNCGSEQVGQLEVDLFQYYRRLRNLIVHDPERDQRKTDRRTCEHLKTQVDDSPYSTLEAPNHIDELCFDDFVLLTRIGKQLAANLCAMTNPTDEEFIAKAENNVSLMKKLRALSNNQQRCENLVAGFFRERYSVPDDRSRRLGLLLCATAR